MESYRGCHVPPDRSYDLEGDLWVRFEGDLVRLGMTDVAQTRMGRMVSILFKRPGRRVKAGGSVATVESAKWVGPIHTPFAGEVVEVAGKYLYVLHNMNDLDLDPAVRDHAALPCRSRLPR